MRGTAKQASERLKAILVKDKIKAEEGFLQTLKSDLTRLLGDFFELTDGIDLKVELTDGGEFTVSVDAKARRIKKFMSV